MSLTERRKQQLRLDGINTERIEKITDNIIEEMRKCEVTIQESKVIVCKLNCIIKNIEKRSSDTPLNKILNRDF